MFSKQLIVSAVVIVCLSLEANAQNSVILAVPGAATLTGVLASSTDGMSRYLAKDGPIQPAITAIGGLPMRGVEYLNLGINSVSNGLNNGAQGMARAAGHEGDVSMPGMAPLRSIMPESAGTLGSMMHGAIRGKNLFIAGQADAGVQAGVRLGEMMQGALVRNKRSMGGMENHPMMAMMSSAQESLMKSGKDLKNQLQQSISGHMSRMQGVQGIGDNVRNQVQGIGQTVSSGLSGAMEHLQRTGQQVHSQIQGGVKQNMGALQGIMGSMQGSMGNMGQNMQKNFQGVVQHAQQTAQQLTQHLHQAAQGPLSMIQNLGSGLGNMMGGGGMNVQSSGGHGGKKY